MIIRTAIPLIAEYGTAVTTAKVARAAGIGEATIFRVFADKDDLMEACLAEAARPDQVLDELAAIPRDQPLPARLESAVDAVYAHLGRMGAVVGALQATGYRFATACGQPPPDGDGPNRDDAVGAITAALADVLGQDARLLRLPAHRVAGVLFNLVFGPARPGGADLAEPRFLVDVLLNGALLPPTRETETP
ncbi:TetR/AcrR family transcriptional regulator [Streptomyces radiopugnans]|nr:TetR/AcrR family transcriptional regulator [Streptomyces radiopugnans]